MSGLCHISALGNKQKSQLCSHVNPINCLRFILKPSRFLHFCDQNRALGGFGNGILAPGEAQGWQHNPPVVLGFVPVLISCIFLCPLFDLCFPQIKQTNLSTIHFLFSNQSSKSSFLSCKQGAFCSLLRIHEGVKPQLFSCCDSSSAAQKIDFLGIFQSFCHCVSPDHTQGPVIRISSVSWSRADYLFYIFQYTESTPSLNVNSWLTEAQV